MALAIPAEPTRATQHLTTAVEVEAAPLAKLVALGQDIASVVLV
jgi:hypothetical protein